MGVGTGKEHGRDDSRIWGPLVVVRHLLSRYDWASITNSPPPPLCELQTTSLHLADPDRASRVVMESGKSLHTAADCREAWNAFIGIWKKGGMQRICLLSFIWRFGGRVEKEAG